MATYNGEKYIVKQVDSILSQLRCDDEIIVSDDGSSDNTIILLAGYNDNRIKIYQNHGRKGPVGNFENALKHAIGDYIFLADQDDIWLETKLQTHLKAHEKHDLVISDCYVVKENGQIIYDSFFEKRGSRAGLINNLHKNSYVGCCMSFSRKILNVALPFPAIIHMHDWWIGLVAEMQGKPFFCTDKLMYYVRHDSNASPTLENSGYSLFRRTKHRLQLLYRLSFLLFNNK